MVRLYRLFPPLETITSSYNSKQHTLKSKRQNNAYNLQKITTMIKHYHIIHYHVYYKFTTKERADPTRTVEHNTQKNYELLMLHIIKPQYGKFIPNNMSKI